MPGAQGLVPGPAPGTEVQYAGETSGQGFGHNPLPEDAAAIFADVEPEENDQSGSYPLGGTPPAEGPPAEQTPQAPQAQPVGGEQQQQPAEGAPAEGEPGQPMYAGRYRTVEDLERGYQGIQQLTSGLQSRLDVAARENAEMRQFITAIRPHIEPLLNGERAPAAGPAAAPPTEALAPLAEALGLDQQQSQILANSIAGIVQSQVDAQVAPLRTAAAQQQAMGEQIRGEQWQTAMSDLAMQFRSAHPDVMPDSPEEYAAVGYVDQLGLPRNLETAEFGLELVRDQFLQQAVAISPQGAQTPQGRSALRQMANSLRAGAGVAPVPVTTPGGSTPVAASAGNGSGGGGQRPFVEGGKRGAPIQGPPGAVTPQDDVLEIVQAYQKNVAGRSPLFGRSTGIG
jgi:hypothetical protein